MAQITVKHQSDTQYVVQVQAASTTTHNVTLDDATYRRLTEGRVTQEKLIERSFEFLLDHEPNTSILRSFDLPVIGRYFPNYEKEIKQRLS